MEHRTETVTNRPLLTPSTVHASVLPWLALDEEKEKTEITAQYLTLGEMKLRRIPKEAITLAEKVLGKGQGGVVYLGHWQGIGVAVKQLILPSKTEEHPESWREFVAEAEKHGQLSHPHIVAFYGIVMTEPLGLVVELCVGGTLRKHLDTHTLAWPEKQRLAREVALGLQYLHEAGIYHGDLAADNVLLDENLRAKLTDFGLSVKQLRDALYRDQEGYRLRARPKWAAPEVFVQKSWTAVTASADIYSLGVVWFEIFSQKYPLATLTIEEAQAAVIQNQRLVHESLTSILSIYQAHLIACWHASPQRRPGLSELLTLIHQPLPVRTFEDAKAVQACLRTQALTVIQQWQAHRLQPTVWLEPAVSWQGSEGQSTHAFREAMQHFLTQAHNPCLLLVGETGSGKRLALSEWAKQELTTPTTLWLPGLWDLSTVTGETPHIVEHVLREFSLDKHALRLFAAAGGKLVWLVTAAPGCSSALLQRVIEAVAAYPMMKLVLAIRPAALAGLQAEYVQAMQMGKSLPFTTILHLQPFTRQQQVAYWQACGLSVDESLTKITLQPGSKTLLRSPALLAIAATLWASSEEKGEGKHRMAWYGALLQHYLRQKQQKLQAQGLLTTEQDQIAAASEFAAALALTMFELGTTVACYRGAYQGLYGKQGETSQFTAVAKWGRFFDHRYHPLVPVLRQMCPIVQVGNDQWQFQFPVFQEYFTAAGLLAHLQPSWWGNRSLTALPGVMTFLADAVRVDLTLQHTLRQWVKDSVGHTEFSQLAANAISVLHAAGISFWGWDLQGVNIPGADLSGAILGQANLQQANLQAANLSEACLVKTNLTQARVNGVNWGEAPAVRTNGQVRVLCVSPNQRWVAWANQHIVQIRERVNEPQQFTFQQHQGSVLSLAFRADSQCLASGSEDQTIRLWFFDDETVNQQTLSGHRAGVTALCFHPQAALLASASRDGEVKVWQVTERRCLLTLTHTAAITHLIFLEQGAKLLAADKHGKLVIWTVSDGQCIQTVARHTASLVGLALENGTLITVTEAGELRYDDQSHQLAAESILTMAVSSDARLLALGHWDKRITLWSLPAGKYWQTLTGHQQAVKALAFAEENQVLISGSDDQSLRTWQLSSRLHEPVLQHTGDVVAVAIAADGETIASGDTAGYLCWWNKDGHCQDRISLAPGITSLKFSGDKLYLASGHADGSLRIWSVKQRKCQQTFLGHQKKIHAIVWLPGDTHLVSASEDANIKLWQVAQGCVTATLTGHRYNVTALAVDEKTKCLYSGSDDKTIKIWSLITHQCTATFTAHEMPITSLALTEDGQWLVTASHDQTVKVWSVAEKKCLYTLTGHTASIHRVAILGTELITAGSWDLVRRWSLSPVQALGVLSGHYGFINSLSTIATSEGKYLAVGYSNQRLQVWEKPEKEWRLRWQSGSNELLAENAVIAALQGVSSAGLTLLQQRGAQTQAKSTDEGAMQVIVAVSTVGPSSVTTVPTSSSQPSSSGISQLLARFRRNPSSAGKRDEPDPKDDPTKRPGKK